MTLGINEDGEWQMDLDKAKEFWRNLDSVLPEEIGSVLSPMPISKISFEKSNTGDTDTISEAEQNMLTIIAGDDKPIKCVYEGDPIVVMGDPLSNGDLTQEYLYGEKYGMGIVLAGGNAGIGRYEIA